MRVRCEHDGTTWDTTPKPYPSASVQSIFMCKMGDLRIACPTCGRSYFLLDNGRYESDRILTILEQP